MYKVISLSPTKTRFGPLLFSGDLEFGLEQAKILGYDGVELSLGNPKEVDFTWLQTKLDRLNLKVKGIATGQSYYNDGLSLFTGDPEKQRQAINRMKDHIDLAAKLGAMVIIGGIRGKIDETKDYEAEFKKGKVGMREIAQYGQEQGVILLLELINRYETNIFNTLDQGIEFLSSLSFENIKLLADTFHMNIEEAFINDSLKKAGKYLGYVHFADSNRLAPGWGHIDFKTIFQTLKEISFNGPVGIEVLPQPGDMEAARQGIEYLNNLFQTRSDLV